MRRLFAASSLFILFFSSVAAHAQDATTDGKVESILTELEFETACVLYGSYEQGGNFSCPGYGGYGVLFSEDDQRQSVFYGYVGAWFGEGAWESFSGFNNVSGTIEWRVRDKVPYATIMRWFISPEGESADSESQGEVLVVSRVAQPGEGEGCVVGYVDALENENANELAREIADTMTEGFPCRIEDPQFHGAEGVAAGFPVRTFGP